MIVLIEFTTCSLSSQPWAELLLGNLTGISVYEFSFVSLYNLVVVYLSIL